MISVIAFYNDWGLSHEETTLMV